MYIFYFNIGRQKFYTKWNNNTLFQNSIVLIFSRIPSSCMYLNMVLTYSISAVIRFPSPQHQYWTHNVFFFTYRPIREPHITRPCNHSERSYHLGAYFLGFLPTMHCHPFSLTVIHFSFHSPSSLNDTSLNNTILISLLYPSIFHYQQFLQLLLFATQYQPTQLLVPSHPSLTHPSSAPQLVRSLSIREFQHPVY
jgi:hypothetical protein